MRDKGETKKSLSQSIKKCRRVQGDVLPSLHTGTIAVIQAAHVQVYKSNKKSGDDLFNALRKSPQKDCFSLPDCTRGTVQRAKLS